MTIIGEAFRVIAGYETEGLGLPELPLAIVEYPMGGVPREEAVRRAHRAFGQILAGITLAIDVVEQTPGSEGAS